MTKSSRMIMVLLICLLVPAPELFSQDKTLGEHAVKAGLLFKFIPFVEWPKTDNGSSTLTIGVVGEHSIGNTLRALEGRKVGSRTVVVKQFDSNMDMEQIKQCQVLYVVQSKRDEKRLIKAISGLPILTIGDSEAFAERGGMIGFVIQGEHMVFEVNNASVKEAGLCIRSQLMRLAHRVFTEMTDKGGL